MAEAGGLNPLQHGFESHRGHCIGLLAIARAGSRSRVRRLRRRSQTERRCLLAPSTLLAPLAEAGACWPLPSSLARRRKACLLPRSSRTAARQPGSARRRAIRGRIARSVFDCWLSWRAFPVPGRQTWLVSASDTPVGRRGMGNADRAAGGLLNKAHSCFKAGRRGPCPAFQ